MMKFKILILLMLSFLGYCNAQEIVHYIQQKPLIDGVLDKQENLTNLKSFEIVKKSNKANEDVQASYYLGYGADFLYLYIEIDADNLVMRDRAYQNGDGFHMVIGKANPDMSATDEFYVLAFSPDENAFFHKRVWYHDIDLSAKKMGAEVKFKTKLENNKVAFELFLPWKSVYPYHPLFSEAIGFNLCFVKAIDKNEKNYYFVFDDDKIQNEQSKRKYSKLKFETADESFGISSYLASRNISSNEYPRIMTAGLVNKETTCKYTVKIFSGENQMVSKQYFTKTYAKGSFSDELILDKVHLDPAGYRIRIETNEKEVDYYLSVLPNFDTELMQKRLDNLKKKISLGTYNTLSFYIEKLKDDRDELKEYETSLEIRTSVASISKYLEQIDAGIDPLKEKQDVFRRAFVSKIDSTLRPYSIYIPKNFDVEKKYPLLVHLHGSGQDDKALFLSPKIENDFIIIAPNARGTSNCYVTTNSQIDIEEAIEDVVGNYNIDESQIILSGFSMGGYGVYHTYYHHPDRYKAIAINSGHPNLGIKWGHAEGLNFLKKKNLKRFSNIPIFIFHGTRDMNCPFELTQKLVKQLEVNCCDVKFLTEKTGHGKMNKENKAEYHNWLRAQVKE